MRHNTTDSLALKAKTETWKTFLPQCTTLPAHIRPCIPGNLGVTPLFSATNGTRGKRAVHCILALMNREHCIALMTVPQVTDYDFKHRARPHTLQGCHLKLHTLQLVLSHLNITFYAYTLHFATIMVNPMQWPPDQEFICFFIKTVISRPSFKAHNEYL